MPAAGLLAGATIALAGVLGAPVSVASDKAVAKRAESTAAAGSVGQVGEVTPSMAPTSAASDQPLSARYAAAIQARIQANWMRPDHLGNSLYCQVRIRQAPGGRVLSVEVMAGHCDADESTRRSVQAAVWRAQPLPYEGFESAFNEQVLFTFRFADN